MTYTTNLKIEARLYVLIVTYFGLFQVAVLWAAVSSANLEIHAELYAIRVAGSDENREARVQSMVHKYGASLVPRLIGYLHDVHLNSYLNSACIVMRAAGPDTASTLITAINSEDSPAQKAKLIRCLREFGGPAVIACLRAQLDDARLPENEPPSTLEGMTPATSSPRYEAYEGIIEKLDGRRSDQQRAFDSASLEQRVALIEALKIRVNKLPAK